MEEATIPTDASWAYTQAYLPEDDVLRAARQRADEIGCTPVDPGTGAALRLLAALVDAKAVVEVGTGTGVSGLWLLRGMRGDGILTTVDSETEHARLARETFVAAGLPAQRTRLITGRALEVLTRLADGGYDLVFFDGAKDDYATGLEEAHRLLRSGGVVAFDDALWNDKVADPAQRDPDTVAMRGLVCDLRDDERWLPVLLPVGNGLLAAQKRS
ncbi:MAG: O-methyltransferase [Actinomycetes bacterium]